MGTEGQLQLLPRIRQLMDCRNKRGGLHRSIRPCQGTRTFVLPLLPVRHRTGGERNQGVTVPLGQERTFYTVRIPYHPDFDTFYREARRIITSIPEDGDPYGTDKQIARQGDFDVFLFSATPKLYFTSITYTQQSVGHPLDYPLMNAGKAITRAGRLYMPIALTVSHAFADGAHISLFFEKVEQTLKEL